MKIILAYILSPIYFLFFVFFLLLFHPIQWLSLKLGGYKAHKKSVDYLNMCLCGTLYILGTRIKFRNSYPVPTGVPLIIVSNHQSMNDIPPYLWFMRKHHPKFVSKKELGKWIPSISFNLKHGGSCLIDRKDADQALNALKEFGENVEQNNWSAVIFPEGTRSKDGKPKRFSEKGLKMLVDQIPSAYVVPVTVNNSWKFQQYGKYPMGVGVNLTFDVHEPLKASELDFQTLFTKVEKAIVSKVI